MGNEEEDIDKVTEPKTEEVAVRESDEAILEAASLLDSYERLYTDPKKRAVTTGTAGVVVGAGLNAILDYRSANDPKKKKEALEIGVNTLGEVSVAILRTLVAGAQRRSSNQT